MPAKEEDGDSRRAPLDSIGDLCVLKGLESTGYGITKIAVAGEEYRN